MPPSEPERCPASRGEFYTPRGVVRMMIRLIAYHDYTDVAGFARVVDVAELAENDFNLNIRRYVDNTPPPESQDVRAHLHGDVPEVEGIVRVCARANVPVTR
jgi:type I restriction-modification system DNA methylase subunit